MRNTAIRDRDYRNKMEPALRNRLTFGPIMLASLLGLLWLDHAAETWTAGHGFRHQHGIGGIGLLALLLIILPPAVMETAHLLTAERIRPYRFIATVGSGAVVVHAFLTQFDFFEPIAASSLAFIVVAVMLLAALRRAWIQKTEGAIHHMAGTVLATLYLGGLAWFLLALRVKHATRSHQFEGSTLIVVFILLTVKFTDIGAYFGGMALGKHKMILWLSPRKTWEGLFCGLFTAGLTGMAMAPLIGRPMYWLPWWKGFLFGVLLGGIGQVGDLLESLMKRDAEVKDSGSLIPGFGGVLDVIDSPLLAAPFAYLAFSLL